MARAHTKRIIRALSGQTVASYAAKTIPVDAAIAAQMRKFFEQNAKQSLDHETSTADELPLPSQADQGSEGHADYSPQISQPHFTAEAETIDPSSLDDLLPSMDELLGSDLVASSEMIQEIEQPTVEDAPAGLHSSSDETTSDIHINEDTQQIELDDEITEHDLAQLAEELDDFLEDADNLDIDLVEQKEKLAAILQELPSPDPESEPLEFSQRGLQSLPIGSESPPPAEDFTLPWEGEDQPVLSEVPGLETSETENVTPENSPNFQDVLQQVQTAGTMIEQPLNDRAYTVIIIPRIAFHQLGQSFEHKFEQYLQQACQQGQCQVEDCSFFSDHIQLKLTLGGKSSIVKTIMQIKKQLETKILQNYATFSDELEGNDLWLPGQLIFNDQEKLDSKRIQTFITNARL